MRKLVPVAVVVAGVLVGAGPGPAEAGPGKSAYSAGRSLSQQAGDLGRILSGETAVDEHKFEVQIGLAVEQFNDGDTTPEELREDILEEIEGLSFDLLAGANRQWNEKVEEVRTADAEVAAEQSAAGQIPPTAADALYASELLTTKKFNISLGKTLGGVRKVFVASGRPVSIVGRGVPAPQHPAGYVGLPMPNIFAMMFVWGECNGTATVLTLDPAVGQEPPVDESYIQFVDAKSLVPVAELRTRSAVDFPGDKPAVFEFTGLAPGTYSVRVGVIKDGVHGHVAYETFTIPDWGGTQIEADKTIAAQAKALGLSLRRFVKEEGSALVKEVKAIAKELARGTIDEDAAYERFVERMRAAHGRIGELNEAHRDQWMSGNDVLRMTNPRAADNELIAGTGSSADRVQTDEQGADDSWRGYLDKAAATFGKVSAKLGSPIAYAQSPPGRTPHPASDPPATQSRSRSFYRGMSVLATCSGNISMFVVDPRDGDEIDRVFVEIREIDTRTLVLRRELVDNDFDEDYVALVEAAGLLQPGRTYDVRLVSGGDPPFATLDAAVITCPNWNPAPSSACDRTTASVTHDGQSLAIPPLFAFNAAFVGNGLQSIDLVFRDPAKPTDPSVNFSMLVSTPIPLDTSIGDLWTFTYPPRVAGLGAYVYDPKTFYFTSASTATVTITNLKNLLAPPGCTEVVIDGTTPEMKPVRFRFTLHTDQMNK